MPYLIVSLAFAFITGMVAKGRGRSGLGWGIFGFFFPLLALILVFVLSDLGVEKQKEERLKRQISDLKNELNQEKGHQA